VTVLLVFAPAVPTGAQLSSDLPGVPRASVPFAGGRQSRGEFDFLYFKVPIDGSRDTLAFGARIGLGRSYRIQSRWEVGFDLTLVEGMHNRESRQDSTQEQSFAPYTRGLLGYGFRIGAKFTPISSVSPEGFGYHAGVGVAFQPKLQPLFGISFEDDSTYTGGQFIKDEGGLDDVVQNLPQSIQVAAMGSYRSRRVSVDGALIWESQTEETASEPLAVERYSGLFPRVGAKFQLTRSIAPGLVFWGSGAPPWRDRITERGPGEDESQFGLLISFGSRRESGTDLLIMSPRGSFGEAIRLYIRTRSTN